MARANHKRKEQLVRRRLFTRIIFVTLIIISIGLIFISQSSHTRFAPIRNAIEATGGRIVSIIDVPLKAVRNFGSNILNIKSVHKDNERLRDENVTLRQYQFRARALEAKLSRLESMMSVQDGLDIPKDRQAVRIITKSRGPFAYSVLINAGQKSDIKVGYPVMHDTGLLGHVIRVGRSSSRVLLLNDLNSRISVMSVETGARAVLIGRNDDLPQLAFYDNAAKWKTDVEVVTSGDGGVFPQGLPIGKTVRRSDEDIRLTLLPHSQLDWAWVIPFSSLQTPEDDPIENIEDKVVASEVGGGTE